MLFEQPRFIEMLYNDDDKMEVFEVTENFYLFSGYASMKYRVVILN
jgi:hypothetical protein